MTSLAFNNTVVRQVTDNGRTAWLATDVAVACGANPQAVKILIHRHAEDFVDGQDYSFKSKENAPGGFSIDLIPNPGGRPALWLFESGVHMFCMLSRAPMGFDQRQP